MVKANSLSTAARFLFFYIVSQKINRKDNLTHKQEYIMTAKYSVVSLGIAVYIFAKKCTFTIIIIIAIIIIIIIFCSLKFMAFTFSETTMS
jgi:hypothetical protein